MKKMALVLGLMTFTSLAFSYSRSVVESTKLKDISEEHKILITEDLEPNKYITLGKLVEGKEAAFGSWCYLYGEEAITAGTILDVRRVEIEDTAGKLNAKWLKIELSGDCEINCLRVNPGNIKVKRVENLLNGNIKFIK